MVFRKIRITQNLAYNSGPVKVVSLSVDHLILDMNPDT
jgi:hypothetical protein